MPRMPDTGRSALGWLTGAAMLAGTLGGLSAAPATAEEMTQLTQAELVRTLIPTVVNITARAEVADEPDTMQAGASQPSPSYELRVNAGSGFIIDPSGLIATNWHVVTGAFEINVTFSDGSRVPAEVVQAARAIDLALLKVDPPHKLIAARWGDSSKVQVGDPVLAIGNALGIGMSVSAGIVSALNRNISDTPYDDFIQTDAAINHGNSGGPLFDTKGEVIGVNSAIISPTAASAGLGFSLPANDARYVLDRLAHRGEYARPAWLGAKIQPVTPEMAEAMGQKDPQGSIVAGVLPDGPAKKAGLSAGDVILRFGGETPTDDRALLRQIIRSKPGSEVKLGVLRDGREIELDVKLGEWPQMMWERNLAPPRPEIHLNVPPDLGVTATALTDDQRAKNEIGSETNGLLVTGVVQGTDAARRGLSPGDIIMAVARTPTLRPDDLQREIDRARSEGHKFALFLVLPKKQPTSGSQFPGPKWFALRVSAN